MKTKIPLFGKRLNLSGKKFNMLTAVHFVEMKGNDSTWLFNCDCGKTAILKASRVKTGYTKSCGCLRNKEFKERAINDLLCFYKLRAKAKNRVFEIEREQFARLIESECYYCGIASSNNKKIKEGEYFYNGLDRIDSKLGYFSDNVVPCCCYCNTAKSDMEQEEYRQFIQRVYNKFGVEK